MKRSITALLSLFLLITSVIVFPMTADAEFPAFSDIDGYENVCLTYTWNPNATDNGRHYADDFMPYVSYYDERGTIKDFFFDSYLFLPCNTYGTTGASLHHSSSNPTLAEDWTTYIEDTFYENANVNALDTAFGQAKVALNAPDKKAGVFFTILYPAKQAGSSFGSLGGKSLNFNKYSDRQYAVKWMIDEQIRLYNEAGYENLDLVGFYWLEEYLSKTYTTEDTKLFQYASDYLHSLGLKFIWIPYYNANGYAKWQTLGFDVACYQPNMFWQTTADESRVSNCVSTANRNGMCVEIEIDHRVFSDTEYYNRYLDYLEGCMLGGAMDTIKMYYQGGKTGTYYSAWYTGTAISRSIYDLTYKYAKGTLTQDDIDKYRKGGFALSDEIDWVSFGKSYTATDPYYSDGSVGYQNNDGTELTDGKLATSTYDTDWHAFHNTLLDSDGRMSVTIDLEEVTGGLTNFFIQFSNINLHGIGAPADDVKIYISDNGTDFKLLAQPPLQYSGISTYIEYVTEAVSARYVKYTFINNTTNFVFCGEAAVGKPKDSSNDGSGDGEGDNEDGSDSNTNILLGRDYEISGCGITSMYYANLTDNNAMSHLNNNAPANWFAFYYNSTAEPSMINAPSGVGYVIFDLESKHVLNSIRLHLINNVSWAISAPEIYVYVSNNGSDWGDSVAQINTLSTQNVGYWTEITGEWNGRYLMIEFVLSDIFAFVNEIEAYGTPLPADENGDGEGEGEGEGNGTEEEPFLSGDVNLDGFIDTFDYLLIKRSCYGAYTLDEKQKKIADVDNNGEISSSDYMLVKRWVLTN